MNTVNSSTYLPRATFGPAGTPPPPNRPNIIAFDRGGTPPQLAALKQWVCWRLAYRPDKDGKPGKFTKEPINPATGRLASTTDASSWGTLDEAIAACPQFSCDGVGFVLWKKLGTGIVGLDLDTCRDAETGEIEPWALAIVERMGTYCEPSCTGTGLRLFLIGTLPPGGNRRGKIECYDDARFFTVTGRPLPGFETIERRDDELAAWHAETFPAKPKAPATPAGDRPPLDVGDEELLRRCQGSPRFARLWDGDDGDYGGDASAADLAFCNVVVRNGGGRGQADALYRRSPRARQKWDGRRGDRTYGEMTLDQAFDGTVIPWRPAPRLTIAGDGSRNDAPPNEGPNPQDAVFLPDDVGELKEIIRELTRRIEGLEHRAETAEARADMLGKVQSQATSIIRNKNLGQERFTALTLAYRFGNRESVSDTGDDGLYRVKLKDVAREAGVSDDTAAAHIAKLADAGVLRKKLEWRHDEQYVDVATGEIRTGAKVQFIGPVGNVIDFIEAVAQLVPDKKKAWGGARTCPNHPDAEIVKTTTWTCAECGEVLRQDVSAQKPQDAGLVDDDLAATGTDGPIPAQRGPTPPRGRTSIHRNGPGSHKPWQSPPHPMAAGWSQARSFIGTDPPTPHAGDYEDLSV